MKRLFLTVAAAALLSSCSVKEERSGCPCLLKLDFDEVIDNGRYEEAMTTLSPSLKSAGERTPLRIGSYKGIGYEVGVPRRLISVSAVCGAGQELFDGDAVMAGDVPVMAFAASADCRSDTETVRVRLHKQYCRVTVQPEGFASSSEYPFRVRINASTGALDIFDLSPCGSPWTGMLDDDLTVDVPRQRPDALLTLDMLSDSSETVFSIDLSAKLEAAGYDWTDEDLADISVKVDFVRMTCSVAVLPWDESSEYRQIDI